MKGRRGTKVFLSMLCALFGCLGAWIAIDQYRFESRGVSAKARVVQHETLYTADKYRRPIQRPVDVLEFTTTSGRTVRFSDVGTRNDEHRPIGEQSEIFYPESAPEKARLAGSLTAVCLMAWGFCLVFLLIALNPRLSPGFQQPTRTHRNAQRRKRQKRWSRR